MNERKAIITIYNDGSVERVDISAGELRNIGEQLIAMADSVVIRGNIPESDEVIKGD